MKTIRLTKKKWLIDKILKYAIFKLKIKKLNMNK